MTHGRPHGAGGPMLLLSAYVEDGAAKLKFYSDSGTVVHDAGRHAAYGLVEDGGGEPRLDLITDSLRRFRREDGDRDGWEGSIHPAESYLYDHGIIPGCWYVPGPPGCPPGPHPHVKSARMQERLSEVLAGIGDSALPDSEGLGMEISRLADMLDAPVPEFRRCAFDIETEGVDTSGRHGVTAVAFSAGDMEQSFVLASPAGTYEEGGVTVRRYESESEMISDAISVLRSYPVILSYFGDGFDVPYLANRAERLGIAHGGFFRRAGDRVLVDGPVHVDLYGVFSNRSLQNYAFSGRYDTYGLDAVSSAMTGQSKIGSGSEASRMPPADLARYCHHDAAMTYGLSAYDGGIVMQLLVILARITSLPIDRLSRTGISRWILSMMHRHMRANGMLVPRESECRARNATPGAGFEGGKVLDAEPGVHWDVTVLDFASMYPGLIERNNISWETVGCPHPECRGHLIPGTEYWSCSRRNGMMAVLIGALRKLRVGYYKRLARDGSLPGGKGRQYDTISQAIKVLMNASYGVMAMEAFPLYYLPVADSITASGRRAITGLVEYCRANGVDVLYGDTDSVFIRGADEAMKGRVIEEAGRRDGVELEVDREYRYMILSGLKKNYVGIRKSDGKADVKGLTGKKSHTPPFISAAFSRVISLLAGITEPGKVDDARGRIRDQVRADVGVLRDGDIPLNQLAFRMNLSRDPAEYSKALPQHVRAANALAGAGTRLGAGDSVAYVKTRGGAVPVEMASASAVDRKKYVDFLASTLDQILPAMGISARDIADGTRQESMGAFFPC